MKPPRVTAGNLPSKGPAFLPLLVACLLVALLAAQPAAAGEPSAPWWWTGAEVSPTNLPPEHEGEPGHQGEGVIIAAASNLGAGPSTQPVIVADHLPAGLTATAITPAPSHATTGSCSLSTLQCTFTGTLYPYERVASTITVKVDEPAGTKAALSNEVVVEGGGAPHPASSTQQLHVDGAPTPFGLQEGFELAPYSADGSAPTLAGSHPFQLTSTVIMNQSGESKTRTPAALPRNFRFQLPLGLIGDPQATEQCSSAAFAAHAPVSEVNLCPPGSVVGVATVTLDEPETVHVNTITDPVFNLTPSQGEPARFGFEALGLVPVIIDTSVSAGNDYAITATVKNATQIAGLLSTQVTFWGVPGDPLHNPSRGWECIGGGVHFAKGEVSTPCPASPDLGETPLLSLPTSCPQDPTAEPFRTSLQVESWQSAAALESEYVWRGPLHEALGFTECESLPFDPQLTAAVGGDESKAAHAGASPTALTVTVRLPQGPTVEPDPKGRTEADVRDTTVTLPAGVQLNPSAANGLQACPEKPEGGYEGVGFEGFERFLGSEREPEPEVAVHANVSAGGIPRPGPVLPSCLQAGHRAHQDATATEGTRRRHLPCPASAER